MIDIRQSENYAKYMRLNGWTVERIKSTNYLIRKIPLLGGILKIQRPKKIDFKVIHSLSRKYGIFYTIIEPDNGGAETNHVNLLLKQGYRQSKITFLPTKTLLLDLTQSKAKILAGFKKDARYAIKRGENINAKSYSSPNEIKVFREAWKKAVNFKRHVPDAAQLIDLRKSFPQSRSMFLASHNISGRIIGGVIFTVSSHDRSNYIKSDKIAYYWQGFTNKEGRSSLSQYTLLYRGILWAKKNGCKIFDFEGVYDPRFPDPSWLGFSHFKRSFGGREVLYPGCYTKFRLPF